MDFLIGSTMHALVLLVILLSYDIACQWFINMFKQMDQHWPDSIKISPATELIPTIPKLHEPMHAQANHKVFSLNFIPGIGKSDLETPVRLDTGAPSGYLDPYLQVFSDKNPYLDLQGSFPTVHLDPQVFYLQVTGQQVLKVPIGIQ